MNTNLLYGPAIYAGLAVLFSALFVLNAFTHGTALGLIGTGGSAAVTGYTAYRAWSRARRRNRR